MKAIIVDDHALFRVGLKEFLISSAVFTEVIEAECYETAVRRLQEHDDIKLVLTDLHMPGNDGIEGIGELVRLVTPIPLVVISADEKTDTMRDLVLAGAAGFIQKSSSIDVIKHAIHVVLDGGIYLPHRSLLSPQKEAKKTPERQNHLSDRQVEILTLLTEGMSNKEIARALELSEGTVKQHLVTIYKHLNVKTRTQATVAALGLNIVNMDLIYFNSSSSKLFFDFFDLLDENNA
ncbi:MAG: DNA-binding response regulator [Zetaproteobacteria bacterium CG_4_9_14_3_um_filter_49_83]|nr:MAG: hypothetical protein AUJ56_12485 [Zetaproteobacteria bacterium CG1_02_49_23]PIQ34575.1 MAG: DNA-binding response regulator [Zetaproteobacteria bacterium CG17_big_fil_post_rev_8_21_14_2_50_50_13]PIV31564.1 MAG: DNA-binding response regulator [Zetaproteobacteria bacterium CG02_land_8_20_14_3_00_50_9]PIY54840.1 MAG: DNA-binding response regulator [Zetaproteobacteria bacterium CG_4_10_14_0_8_um_filter_49_80]PJA35793.1 MAG: DNA-binding response regulator [Zetaproteobacteria bacterium CG_4_9_